jgi:hypothetical protein
MRHRAKAALGLASTRYLNAGYVSGLVADGGYVPFDIVDAWVGGIAQYGLMIRAAFNMPSNVFSIANAHGIAKRKYRVGIKGHKAASI